MKLFRFNPTIKEANRYLSKIVDELSQKHGGVSNEDFEKELVESTGIGWKQVKNYKNHPKPSERLKDNSIILKFIRQKQIQDKSRRVHRFLVYTVPPLVAAVFFIRWYSSKPRQVEQFIVHQVPPSVHTTEVKESHIFLKLSSKGWLFRLGSLNQSSIPLDKFNCMDNIGTGTKNCYYNERTSSGNFQAYILLDGGVIRRYTVLSFNPEEVKDLMGQLLKLLGDKINRFPSEDKHIDDVTVELENELVRLTGSYQRQGIRPYLSVVVSLK